MAKDINDIIQESLAVFDKDKSDRKLIDAIAGGWLDCATNPPNDNSPYCEDVARIDHYGNVEFGSAWFVSKHPELFLYWFPLPSLPDNIIKLKDSFMADVE